MTDLSQRIYRAQCYGNVEPIEHMVPYPNLASLVEGSTIKFSTQTSFPDWNQTNGTFHDHVLIAADWLQARGLGPGDRLYFPWQVEPEAHYMAYATWLIGATLVLKESDITLPEQIITLPHPGEWDRVVEKYEGNFTPTAVPLLGDEACLVLTSPSPVRLSHYQLLVNVNGICAGLPVAAGNRIFSHFPVFSLPWLLFQVLLPLYALSRFTSQKPDITIGDRNGESFVLTSEWKDPFPPRELYFRPEAGGVLCIGGQPIHLMSAEKIGNELAIRGHGVMMGYLSDPLNHTVFRDERCFISL